MVKIWTIILLILLVLLTGPSSASPTPAAKALGGVISKVVSALFKWLWSLKSPAKKVISSRSMLNFMSGYTVETVLDGSKLGIEPYTVEVSPSGELLLLDSKNSNIYKISLPISRYSRPKLLAGSSKGYSGHVDGRLREAKMNRPKGLTVDDRGNIYIADTKNSVIRKISDDGVVTIAGGKWGWGGHVDGPSEDARFSEDFDVVYVGSTCTLLVIDRGKHAIREIQLHDSDCSSNDYGNLRLGVALLAVACFFGYMLALLQHRASYMISYQQDLRPPMKGLTPSPYQRPPKSLRPPLIPAIDEYEQEQSEDSIFSSLGRLFAKTGSSVLEIFGGLFSGSRKKPLHPHFQHQYHQPFGHNSGRPWPVQYAIADGDGPPSVKPRDPTPRKARPNTSKELEQNHHSRQSRTFLGGRNGEFPPHYDHHQGARQQQYQQHHQKHQSSSAKTFYEPSSEVKEIVFGVVQEQGGQHETMVIEPVNYGDPVYSHHNIRSRNNHIGY